MLAFSSRFSVASSQRGPLAEWDFGEWASLDYSVAKPGGLHCKTNGAGLNPRAVGIERLRKLEVYCDLGLNFDWLIVQVVRFVFPLLDGVHGSTGQHRVTLDRLDAGDAAVLADVGKKFDGALEVHLHGLLRILGRNAFDQQSLRHALRYFQFLNLVRQIHRGRADEPRDSLVLGVGGSA